MSDHPTLRPPSPSPPSDWKSRITERAHSAVVAWALESTRVAIGRVVDHASTELRSILLKSGLETYTAAAEHTRALDRRIMVAYREVLERKLGTLPAVSTQEVHLLIQSHDDISPAEVETICRSLGIPLQES